jgi:hypothetical protein
MQVVEKHPKFNFFPGEIVIVISDDKDIYWIAKVTDSDEKKVVLQYFYYTKNRENEKIWKHITQREVMIQET